MLSTETADLGGPAVSRGPALRFGGAIKESTDPQGRAGDGGIKAVYERHFTRVYRYCMYRTGRPADAEDLTAETFTRLIVYGVYRVKEAALLSWLLRVAGNLCTDHLRRSSARGPLESRSAESGLVLVSADDFGSLPDQDIERALSALKRPEQQAVFLRAVEDMSFEEVASAMGKRLGAVKMLYYRALKRMRASLERDGGLDV